MMRRSGASPAVKRWKLCCEMLRRAASGHIEATQLSKFAAASRIAPAVISGWPEAPSSPLHGGGVLLAAGGGPFARAAAPGRPARGPGLPPLQNEAGKMFSKQTTGAPPLDESGRAAAPCTHSTSTIA